MNNIIREEIRELQKKLAYINDEISDLQYDREQNIECIKDSERTGRFDEAMFWSRDLDTLTQNINDLKYLRSEYTDFLNKVANCYNNPYYRDLEETYNSYLKAA